MLTYLWTYLLTLAVIGALDITWVFFLMKNFYATNLSQILAKEFHPVPGILWYLLYGAGILYFVAIPAQGKGLVDALVMGAVLGLMAYGTYNLVNMTTLTQWPLIVTVVDMTWGVILSALAGGASFLILQFFNRP